VLSVGLLHTILFHRALGSVAPKECECEAPLFESISYVKCDNAEIHDNVERSIERFCQNLEKNNQDRGKVCLSFFKTITKKNFFGIEKEDKVVWERWILAIVISDIKDKNSADRVRRNHQRQQQIRERLMCIVKMVSIKLDHIPPVMKRKLPTPIVFPFEISSSAGEKNDESWGLSIKRLLTEGPPLLNPP